MQVKGRIIEVLPLRSGTTANGEWQSQDYVIEFEDDRFTRKMVFNLWGAEKIQKEAITQGEELTVYFDIDARQYNGRWYNSIRAWKIERDAVQPRQQPQQAPQPQQQPRPYQQPQQQPLFTNDPFAPNPQYDNIPF